MNETPTASERSFARLRDWTEPAHPGVIRLYDDLIQVYRAMRKMQPDIDAAFDSVAKQIGYLVTTTLPVRVDVADGKVKSARLDGETLKGTLFEHGLSGFLKDLTAKQFADVPAGSYRLYLIWYNALKLKLRRDWIEPAHVVQSLLNSLVAAPVAVAGGISAIRPEIMEPVHWFDPGLTIAIEDAVVILAIDEVYPELRLSERIAADRLTIRKIRPEVMEPVHFRDILKERDLFADLKQVLARRS